MVGLYQDPQGDNIKISNTHSSHDVPRRDSVYTPDAEIRRLRKRISELEKSQQPSQVITVSAMCRLLFSTSESKLLRIKERRAYRDGIKRKGDKIGMVVS